MLRIENVTTESISVEAFGGKAYGLHLLSKHGLSIPESIAIEATINPEEFDDDTFRYRLKNVLSPFLKDGYYDIVVRSSCTIEDSFANSFAGFFSTFISKMSFDEVILSAKKVISGLIQSEYPNGKMGVVIQPRVNADYSGVLFSSDPISYSKEIMLINYIEGIGDKLVSGLQTGKEEIISVKGNEYQFENDEKDALRPILLELSQKSKTLEALLKYPLDIEWAVEGTKILFLQCRPLTSITSVSSGLYAVNKKDLAAVPAQLINHDKIKLRLQAQKEGVFISDAHVYIDNSCNTLPKPDVFPRSKYCKGYSAVIVYPTRISNKIIRSFVGDKMKVFESITDCCRYGIKSFPKYEKLPACLDEYSNMVNGSYWISATILQEIFDPIFTGVMQKIAEGYIIEITRGHFLTKGVVPTSQYICSNTGRILEKNEVWQRNWLKIVEGHVISCICNEDDEGHVTISSNTISRIITTFSHVLKSDSNVVEFGLLSGNEDSMIPYLIDFVDENSPITISSSDIKSGIVSYGIISGKPIFVDKASSDSLNEHFHNVSSEDPHDETKVVFFCKNPELSHLHLLDRYKPENIGFVFENCAIGAHLAVVLREKGIPAIKTGVPVSKYLLGNTCTIDAKTPGLTLKERLKYE